MKSGEAREALSPSVFRIAIVCALFTLAMGCVFPLFAWYGYDKAGSDGLTAAAIAGGVSWVSAFLSLVVLGVSARRGQVLAGLLLGMMFRMGPPLVACFVFVGKDRPLAHTGVAGMILIYYLAGLLVETLLSVRLVSVRRAPKSGKPTDSERGAKSSGGDSPVPSTRLS